VDGGRLERLDTPGAGELVNVGGDPHQHAPYPARVDAT
jgi:hypothetical protein